MSTIKNPQTNNNQTTFEGVVSESVSAFSSLGTSGGTYRRDEQCVESREAQSGQNIGNNDSQDIPRPDKNSCSESSTLSAKVVKNTMALYLGGGNPQTGADMYYITGKIVLYVINNTFDALINKKDVIPSWGNLTSFQKNYLVHKVEKKALEKNISLNRLKNSWVVRHMLSQKWRTAINDARKKRKAFHV
ncbi:hypothetical protein F4703DRAFT_1793678 [Phycomyces blakesleeanus]